MNKTLSESEVQAKIASKFWMHSFELAPGVVTPGKWGRSYPDRTLDEQYRIPWTNLVGKTVLDIGALDGMFSFELERRGAKVTAFDIQSPDVTGFNTAKEIIGSNVEYVQGDVYNLDKHFTEKFDLICFFGVWYHLKNPVAAFAQVANALKDEGVLLAEGACLFEYMESPSVDSEDLRELGRLIGKSSVALTAYYPGEINGDQWSWFHPNEACVEAWLKTVGLKTTHKTAWHDYPNQRLHVTAVKDPTIHQLVDNPIW